MNKPSPAGREPSYLMMGFGAQLGGHGASPLVGGLGMPLEPVLKPSHKTSRVFRDSVSPPPYDTCLRTCRHTLISSHTYIPTVYLSDGSGKSKI